MLLLRLVGPTLAILLTLIGLLVLVSTSAVARASKRIRDIPYLSANTVGFNPERHILDVYQPTRKSDVPHPVVLFIHGGNWTGGSKNIYWFIGRRLAQQGYTAVIINYRLSPAVQVPAMADDCARAVAWVAAHIGEYGGDPNRIYVMGHSAGGGLAALLATDSQVFTRNGLPTGLVKGTVLDDPAGINMYDYLLKMEYSDDKQYLTSFGKEPAGWKAASPFYQVQAGAPPMRLYIGERTYPSIIAGTKAFHEKLKALGVPSQLRELPRKKHVAMAKMLLWKNNIIYRDLKELTR